MSPRRPGWWRQFWDDTRKDDAAMIGLGVVVLQLFLVAALVVAIWLE